MSNLIRNFSKLGLWAFLTCLSALITAVMVFNNYMGCESALERLNYEMRPLSSDPLMGEILGAFFPNTSMAQSLALLIALIMAFSLFLIFHLLYDMMYFGEHLVQNRRVGNEEEVHAAKVKMISTFFKMFLCGICLSWALYWDYSLFLYRTAADALNIEAAKEAVNTIKNWDLLMRERGHLFSMQMARISAFGYLALTALGCYAFEETSRRLGEQVKVFLAPIEQWFAPREVGYSGNPDEDPWDEYYEGELPEEEAEQEVSAAGPQETDDFPVAVAPAHLSAEIESGSDDAEVSPAADSTTNTVEAWPAQTQVQEQSYDVIGANSDTKVALPDVLSNPERYHYDPCSNMVYDREFWRMLHGSAERVA